MFGEIRQNAMTRSNFVFVFVLNAKIQNYETLLKNPKNATFEAW